MNINIKKISKIITQNQESTSLYQLSVSITDSTPPCTPSCRGPFTQLRTLLDLCALSCRASSYYYNPRHLDFYSKFKPFLHYSSYHQLTLQLRASLYLYNSMVREPWVGRLYTNLQYNAQGGQPYDSIVHFALRARNSRSSTPSLTKTWALSPKTCCGGIPCPTCI